MAAATPLAHPLPLSRDRHELLRTLAHELLRASARGAGSIEGMSIEEVLHEVSVQQVELELQNQELHEARLAMEESKNFLHDLFAMAPVAYLVLSRDAIIEEANHLACDCFSLPRNVLLGQRLSQFVRPESLYGFRELFETPWDHRLPLRRDITFRSHNGREFVGRLEVRRRTLSPETALAEPQWLCALQDITEESRTREALLQNRQALTDAVEERTADLERALDELHKEVEHRKVAFRSLARSNAHYQALFHSNAMGIALVSATGILLDLNAAMGRLLERDPSQLPGLPLAQALDCGEQKLHALLQESQQPIELRLASQAGPGKWVSLSSRRIDPCQAGAGVVVVMHDISEQKELDTLKQEVDRILFHDLRGPIASIHSVSTLCSTDAQFSASEMQQVWGAISDTSKRVLDLINSATDIYHIERGDFRFAPQPTDLLPMIHSVRAELHNLFPNKTVEITVQDDLPSLHLACMPHLFSTMLFNLMQNALEATFSGNAVQVQVFQEQAEATISIHNDTAVDASIRDRFFEKYVTLGKRSGTGLGTYSARRIAEAHGGTIAMTTSEEAGTTVVLTFPV